MQAKIWKLDKIHKDKQRVKKTKKKRVNIDSTFTRWKNLYCEFGF